MKFYAIGWTQIDGQFTFYAYTCKFLSERRVIDKAFYYQLKPSFPLSCKDNNSHSGMYFPNEI